MATAGGGAGAGGAAGPGRCGPGPSAETGPAPPALHPEEVAARLQRMHRELSNRRKILVKNLPQDSSCQEVHDLLQDYELKYCYVDRNKRTAFVTLLNGEQAQNAIRMFHQYSFRGKDLIVQLQPTDALLCITNLPTSFTLEEFEELVRAYGNIERCFLVYSEVTGHSKGYGFVEYMKKDFAAKARLELLGKQLGASALFAQWMDVNLLAAELIHSKCLCIDKLPPDYRDSEELLQFFSGTHKPVFCQLAQDEGSYVGGFAVVEYNTAEHAEEVQQAADGMTIKGSKVQVSFCAPGAPGRSTLAALIAAQRVMHCNQKGLLPEPNPVQIMKSLNNPAMLQVLLQPQLCGRAVKPAVLGTPHSLPHLMNPSISPAFLHLTKAHQSSIMGNASNLFLQNLSQISLAQQQLMKFENIHTNNKPGLLGDPPVMVLQAAVGIGSALPLKTELGHHGEAHKTSNLIPTQTTLTAGMGLLPFFANQHIAGQAGPGLGNTQEKQPASVGIAEGNFSGSQAYLQSFPNLTAGGLLAGHHKQQQSQPKSTEMSSGAASKNQTSLLGEPPKEIRLSKNPYLNLASVLPSVCLSSSKTTLQKTGIASNVLEAVSQENESQHTLEKCIAYSQPFGDYAQVSSLRNEKRGSSYLISAQEGGSVEFVDQHSQGTGAYYMETYLKKKRVY
ncbi:ribonucleoprotein PTB-binding 2 isoform X1 [Pipistrellus kuhlii]|uniref:Ribonucleoprotein PTB-binding 1 n=1 Tax=Pipistrellus kuhlii TaxID=59472 RepID=A0A7J8AAJ3_PIPKU|nr:ribonucleoprotein PTB-binding 2 isoform X1 [Pipistrellus kuhlii]KAF6383411.1 ribonucleoprotein, PTB binding 2 [Pipistrellus kuhlii]